VKPEFIPLYAAAVSAIVAFLVALLTSLRTVRLEVEKIRLTTQQRAFEKLLDVRLAEYPKLYFLLSNLLKVIERSSDTVVLLRDLLRQVNERDSQHSIFLSPEASNICYEFRQKLLELAEDNPGNIRETDKPRLSELLQWAERLELALRSDLGLHGIELASNGSDLQAKARETY
jgi:hypothetical protein